MLMFWRPLLQPAVHVLPACQQINWMLFCPVSERCCCCSSFLLLWLEPSFLLLWLEPSVSKTLLLLSLLSCFIGPWLLSCCSSSFRQLAMKMANYTLQDGFLQPFVVVHAAKADERLEVCLVSNDQEVISMVPSSAPKRSVARIEAWWNSMLSLLVCC